MRALEVLLVLIAASSCAAILGDDFTVQDDDGSSSGTHTCSKDTCNQCIPCCPQYPECFVDNTQACYFVTSCIYDNCGDPDPVCVDDCRAQNPAGANVLDAFADCSCNGECSQICTAEGVCGGGA